MAARPERGYWMSLFTAVVAGAMIVGGTVLLVVDVRASWLYGHAPQCSGTVTSGCRYEAAARMVDFRTVTRARGAKDFQLVMADGSSVQVATLPARWQAIPPGGLPVSVERFDGRIFKVSADGVTLPADDSPDAQLPLVIPGVPAAFGLLWYSARFHANARPRRTGRPARRLPPWAKWPRLVALVIVGTACPAFLLGGFDPNLSDVLVFWSAAVAATALVMASIGLRRRLRPRQT